MQDYGTESYYIEPGCGNVLCGGSVANGLSITEQSLLITSKIIDGVVFVADTLEFFTLSPPLALDRIWVDRRAAERFKGLERWRQDLPHVVEIKLFAIRGYPVSVLLAYAGHKVCFIFIFYIAFH
jgi:hypothetical protein